MITVNYTSITPDLYGIWRSERDRVRRYMGFFTLRWSPDPGPFPQGRFAVDYAPDNFREMKGAPSDP